jgi:hypothetical protein
MENTKVTRFSIRFMLLIGYSIPILIGAGIYYVLTNPSIQTHFSTYKKMYEVGKVIIEKKQEYTEPKIVKSYRGNYTWLIELPIDYVERIRSNMVDLVSSARVKKITLTNNEYGYEIVSIKEGSLFAKSELSVGDRLTHLNDVPIASLAATKVITDTILSANKAKLRFLRSNQGMTFEFKVTDIK